MNAKMTHYLRRLGVFPYLLLGAGLVASGLLAINYVVDNWWPFDVQRLDLVRATAQGRADAATLLAAANSEILFLFLAAVAIAAAGLSLPLLYFLGRRFGVGGNLPGEAPRFVVVLRQGAWVGIWVAFCFWLQMNRTLGVAVALLSGGVLILFEILLQIRARAAGIGLPSATPPRTKETQAS
jgi:hypothetical protein